MARVHLHGIWINDAIDPSDSLRLVKGSNFQPATATNAQTMATSGGRIRGVRLGPQVQTWTLTAQWLTVADIEWLRQHEGRFVWVRDWQGRRIHGWWTATSPDVAGRWASITLTISETSPEL